MTIVEAAADLTCTDLAGALSALLAVGFRVDRISPADDPREADVSGFGTRFRVRRVAAADVLPARLYLGFTPKQLSDERPDNWPDQWELVHYDTSRALVTPEMQPELVISRAADANVGVGRAGMLYRDLIPSRHGGRFIASHIYITDGGPVPDYVHYHRIRFQLIFCARGWAKLVYEDQGEPFIMRMGDAVLQPPEIRHRVLESSDHLEVVEIGCPGDHDTMTEHGFDLPTPIIDRERDFGGQRFVWHHATNAHYQPWDHPGFEARNSGIDIATNGLADVRVARSLPSSSLAPDGPASLLAHRDEFRFHFVLEGSTALSMAGRPPITLERGDSVSVPSGLPYGFRPDAGLELLDVVVR